MQWVWVRKVCMFSWSITLRNLTEWGSGKILTLIRPGIEIRHNHTAKNTAKTNLKVKECMGSVNANAFPDLIGPHLSSLSGKNIYLHYITKRCILDAEKIQSQLRCMLTSVFLRIKCRHIWIQAARSEWGSHRLTLTLMPLFVWLMLEMDEGGAWLEGGLWGESRRLSCDLRTSDRLHSRSVPPTPPPPPPMSLSLSLSVSLPTRPRPSPRPISEPFRDPATWPSSPMPESVWGRPARGESSTGVGVCLSRSEKAVDGCSGGRGRK